MDTEEWIKLMRMMRNEDDGNGDDNNTNDGNSMNISVFMYVYIRVLYISTLAFTPTRLRYTQYATNSRSNRERSEII